MSNRGLSLIVGAGIVAIVFVLANGPFADRAAAQGKPPAPLSKAAVSAQPWTRYKGWPDRDAAKFNTLANPHASPAAPTRPRKLDGPIKGDAANGAKLVADRTRGVACLSCHVMGQAGPGFLAGNIGPDLSEIGAAGRDDEWLFNYIYDARVYKADTVMPPVGTHGIFNDKEIRDIVAFLETLKKPAVFRSVVMDPNKRVIPVEKRNNLDPKVNPAMRVLERAAALYSKRTSSGFACASCHGKSAAQQLGAWAASMPKWEPRLGKVLGVEEFVARHAKAELDVDWRMQSEENTAMSVYLRNLANGREIKVDVTSPGAKEAYERGKALAHLKIGQLNFSCADCHDPSRGGHKWLAAQYLGGLKGGFAHLPTWRTGSKEIWDIRKRFEWCNVVARANELPPDAKEYGDLELYLAAVNSGAKLSVPGIRN